MFQYPAHVRHEIVKALKNVIDQHEVIHTTIGGTDEKKYFLHYVDLGLNALYPDNPSDVDVRQFSKDDIGRWIRGREPRRIQKFPELVQITRDFIEEFYDPDGLFQTKIDALIEESSKQSASVDLKNGIRSTTPLVLTKTVILTSLIVALAAMSVAIFMTIQAQNVRGFPQLTPEIEIGMRKTCELYALDDEAAYSKCQRGLLKLHQNSVENPEAFDSISLEKARALEIFYIEEELSTIPLIVAHFHPDAGPHINRTWESCSALFDQPQYLVKNEACLKAGITACYLIHSVAECDSSEDLHRYLNEIAQKFW